MQVIIGGADKFDPTSLIGVQAVAVTNMVPKNHSRDNVRAMLLAADVDGTILAHSEWSGTRWYFD